MIRMLSMSVRLGIRRHQRDEPLEQIMAVARAGDLDLLQLAISLAIMIAALTIFLAKKLFRKE